MHTKFKMTRQEMKAAARVYIQDIVTLSKKLLDAILEQETLPNKKKKESKKAAPGDAKKHKPQRVNLYPKQKKASSEEAVVTPAPVEVATTVEDVPLITDRQPTLPETLPDNTREE
jgi:hypothetical protein